MTKISTSNGYSYRVEQYGIDTYCYRRGNQWEVRPIDSIPTANWYNYWAEHHMGRRIRPSGRVGNADDSSGGGPRFESCECHLEICKGGGRYGLIITLGIRRFVGWVPLIDWPGLALGMYYQIVV